MSRVSASSSATTARAAPVAAMHSTVHRTHGQARLSLAQPVQGLRTTRCGASADQSGPSTSGSPSVGTVERTRTEDLSKLAVNVVLPTRKPPSTPRPVPIIHSTAYLQQEQAVQLSSRDAEEQGSSTFVGSVRKDLPLALSRPPELSPSSALDDKPYEGNLLQWTLKKVDRSLDELEHKPLPLQQELYDMSRGPVGQATGKGLQAAAELTVKAGVEAAKVVAPVGKWALVNGTKAAVNLIQFALVESAKAKEREKEKERREKNGGKK